jgi:hypothetical protein
MEIRKTIEHNRPQCKLNRSTTKHKTLKHDDEKLKSLTNVTT